MDASREVDTRPAFEGVNAKAVVALGRTIARVATNFILTQVVFMINYGVKEKHLKTVGNYSYYTDTWYQVQPGTGCYEVTHFMMEEG